MNVSMRSADRVNNLIESRNAVLAVMLLLAISMGILEFDLAVLSEKLPCFLLDLSTRFACLIMLMVLVGVAHYTDSKTGFGSVAGLSDAKF